MLDLLRRFDADRSTLEEMLALVTFGKSLRAEYEARGIMVPEWLSEKLRVLNREIESHRRDALELRLKEIRAEQTRLQTPAERREALAKEQEQLEAALAKS